MTVLAATCTAALVVMVIALARALSAKTVYDRILGVNMFGTKTVLFIAIVGFLYGRPDFLDIAIVYALINFIGMIAVFRFSKTSRLITNPRKNRSLRKKHERLRYPKWGVFGDREFLQLAGSNCLLPRFLFSCAQCKRY